MATHNKRSRLKVVDAVRDQALAALIAKTGLQLEPCVFLNCSVSIDELHRLYPSGIPDQALTHAISQSWHGILPVLKKEPVRDIAVVHVGGVIEHVVHARNWLRVHGARVIFELNWLPRLHPYHGLT